MMNVDVCKTGTNVIHDCTAMTFSVKLSIVLKKSFLHDFPWTLPIWLHLWRFVSTQWSETASSTISEYYDFQQFGSPNHFCQNCLNMQKNTLHVDMFYIVWVLTFTCIQSILLLYVKYNIGIRHVSLWNFENLSNLFFKMNLWIFSERLCEVFHSGVHNVVSCGLSSC